MIKLPANIFQSFSINSLQHLKTLLPFGLVELSSLPILYSKSLDLYYSSLEWSLAFFFFNKCTVTLIWRKPQEVLQEAVRKFLIHLLKTSQSLFFPFNWSSLKHLTFLVMVFVFLSDDTNELFSFDYIFFPENNFFWWSFSSFFLKLWFQFSYNNFHTLPIFHLYFLLCYLRECPQFCLSVLCYLLMLSNVNFKKFFNLPLEYWVLVLCSYLMDAISSFSLWGY